MKRETHFIIPVITPDQTLLERILFTLHRKQEQMRLWRVRTFATSAILSVFALVPIVMHLITTIQMSNAGTYLSLVFSDGSKIWKDVVVALIESLPALSITAAIALIGILLWSIRLMVRFMNSSPHGLTI